MATLTTAELALIPAGTALAGVALGIAGNGYLDRRKERRAARDQRDQAIAELLTATVDVITGIQALRAAHLKQGGWRHYIRVSAILVAAMGQILGPGGKFSDDILGDWHRLAPGFERVLTADRDLDDKQRTTALDMATLVLPRTVTFYTAVATLTLGPDKDLANAARKLNIAIADLLEVMAARQRKYQRARTRVEKALAQFRAVADQRR